MLFQAQLGVFVLNLLYKLVAYMLKYHAIPSRYQYKFYTIVKNKPVFVISRIKSSRVKMSLNIGDYVQYWIFMDGCYEPETFNFIASKIKDHVFVDMGANVGNFSLGLCKLAKHIFAFEASKANAEALTYNLKVNNVNNVTVVNRAVEIEDNKLLELNLSPDTSGNNSLYTKAGNSFEKVQSITLDTFIIEHQVKELGLIKIDVEGAEFSALKGAEATLQKFKPIIVCEFNKGAAEIAGWKLIDLYDYLVTQGYKAFSIGVHGLDEFNSDSMDKIGFSENLVYVHKLGFH